MKQWFERHPWAPYGIGYGFSLILTLTAYSLAVTRASFTPGLVWTLAGLAVLQAAVQAICFLHVGREERPRWNLLAFATMIMVVLFIVVGSLWIMSNLNYNMMRPDVIETMVHGEGMHHE